MLIKDTGVNSSTILPRHNTLMTELKVNKDCSVQLVCGKMVVVVDMDLLCL